MATGRSQESRQDVSLSGFALIPPFVASSTNVQVHSNAGYGVLASYRFMLTPNSALEANYGVTYEQTYRYVVGNTNVTKILTRTQEMSGAYVRSFTFRKWNPFVEAGPAGMIFLPIRNSGTTSIDAKQQTNLAGFYGAGFAYEISPSFDIRAEYRGIGHQGLPELRPRRRKHHPEPHHQQMVQPLRAGGRRRLPLLEFPGCPPALQTSESEQKGMAFGHPLCHFTPFVI